MTYSDLLPAGAEIFVLLMTCGLLIIDLFLSDARRHVSYGLAVITVLGAAWITFAGMDDGSRLTFNGLYVDDPLADILKLLTYASVLGTLVYSRNYVQERGLFTGEFFTLVLFAMLGIMVMASASHFLTLYVGLELLSLSQYALVALKRDSAVSTEAAMKYFVLGALSSGLLLYGFSMLYGVTGSLDVRAVASAIQQGVVADRSVLVFGLVFVLAGVGFKLGAAPFHMWLPDVYQGSPTAVTLFIGTAPKIAAFAFLIRVLVEGLQPLVADWQGMLVIMAVLSMAIGNIAAIAQTNLKRMLAYSTISHMGFLLLGILAGTQNGYSSAMFYVAAYALMSLGAFGMILLLSRAGFEAEDLDDFRGLNQRSRWYAFVMLLLMISMAGIPLTVGFFAKLVVFQALIEVDMVWLAVVAILFSVIGAFYYLRIIKLMYFDEPVDHSPITPPLDAHVLMSANGFAIMALGILPQPLMALCAYAIRQSV